MPERIFDEFAEDYDAWFLRNRTLLESEVLLLERFLRDPGKVLSVGCGTGIFEYLLRTEHGIEVAHGVEPSPEMAAVARRRGLEVKIGRAEDLPYEDESFDSVVLNGTPSYIDDLAAAFAEAYRVLRPGGRAVIADVPAESSYALLYQLGTARGGWEGPDLEGVLPEHPYPVELAAAARWRTTEQKAELLRRSGFDDLEFAQTLTRHPRFSNRAVELPSEGYDRGDYVAIRARKPQVAADRAPDAGDRLAVSAPS